MENLNSRTAILDGVSLLRNHMHRDSGYGSGVAQCNDMHYTEIELND
jgi:hypothetical protein